MLKQISNTRIKDIIIELINILLCNLFLIDEIIGRLYNTKIITIQYKKAIMNVPTGKFSLNGAYPLKFSECMFMGYTITAIIILYML